MLRSVGSVREQVRVYHANRYDNVIVNFLLPRRRIPISTFIMAIIEYTKLLYKAKRYYTPDVARN